MIMTFLATLIMPLEYSIYVGVALSLISYVYTSSQNLEVVMLESTPGDHFRETALPQTLPDDRAVIFSIHGHLYFAAVQRLQNMLPDAEKGEHHVVILRLRHNQYMGSTGIRFVCQYAQNLEKHGGRLILAGIGTEIQHQLERTGTLQQLGEENVYYANGTILSATTKALAEANRWLGVTSSRN